VSPTILTHFNTSAQQVLPIPLRVYEICYSVRHRSLEIGFTALSLVYGKEFPLSLHLEGDGDPDHTTDLLAFALIVYLALRPNAYRLPMPSLLRTIAEDATCYFLIIFTSHLVLELTLLLGRVRITPQRSTFPLPLAETFVVFSSTTPWHVSDTRTHFFRPLTEFFSVQQWKHCVRPKISLVPKPLVLNRTLGISR
jgi:hypothetical protein